MAYLIGSASTTGFTSTYGFQSGGSLATIGYVGRGRFSPADPNNSVATGTAQNLWLYISSWGSLANLKACIYDETGGGTLLETVIIPSSAGTGQFSVALAGTTTITTGRLYRIGFYTDTNTPITFYTYTGTGALTFRKSSTGSYSSPEDPSVVGSYDSVNEIYWAIDDVGGDSITPADPITDGGTGYSLTTSGFVSGDITSITIDGVSVSFSGSGGTYTFDNVDIAALDTDATGQVVPVVGGTVTIEATNGTETANTTITNNVKAGWTNTTVASIDTSDPNKLYQQITTQLPSLPTPANGDVWYYPTADSTTITADGGITTNAVTFNFQYTHDVASTLTAYTIEIVNGAVAGGGVRMTSGQTFNIGGFNIGL